MSPLTIGVIGVAVLLLLMFLRMPIGFAMAGVGFLGLVYFRGMDSALSCLGSIPYRTTAAYTLSVVPLFVVMGQFAFYSGLSRDIYSAAYNWIGQLKGGLSMASILACAGFAALSGSSFATAATMGAVSLPEMKRYNYDDSLATGCVAAGGTLGILIPPSIPLVIYGVLVEESIGKLLIAGFIPGILMASLFMVITYGLCKINPNLGPPRAGGSLKEKMTSLGGAWQLLVVFVGMMGGLYAGIFTPTEAGAVGTFLVFFIALVRRRLSWQNVRDSIIETMQITGMIFVILIGAMVFSSFIAFSNLPFELADFLGGLRSSPYLVIVIITVVYVILGCFMDTLAMIVLTVPIFYPLVQAVGFDLIWFGIIAVIMMELGMITPPFGMNVYIIHGIARDIPLGTIFRGAAPYIVGIVVCTILLIVFPQIALFLPAAMK